MTRALPRWHSLLRPLPGWPHSPHRLPPSQPAPPLPALDTLHPLRAARVPLVLALLLSGLSCMLLPDHAAAADVPRFSAMAAGQPVAGWTPFRPAADANDTRYSLVTDGGKTVLRADAQSSMSGLVFPLRADVNKLPVLRWRWKIAAPVQSADMMTKSGDDYAARIYVMFDYPAEKLPFGTRVKLRLAETLYGQKIPTAALNYVWDNRQPVGTIQPNTYTDRARMIVVESGSRRAGQWRVMTRDLASDFRAAFGEQVVPDVIGIAVATDTDNTGETAVAWYGDIEFLPAMPGPTN